MAEAIKIEGLALLSRKLKAIDAAAPKRLRLALNEASDLVIGEAKPRIPELTGRARASLRAASTRTKVRVRAGGRRAPYYPWLDFGGRVGRRARTIRPFLRDGRYIYDSYAELKNEGRFQKVLGEAVERAASDAGFEVSANGPE